MNSEEPSDAAQIDHSVWDLEKLSDREFLNRVIYDPEWFDDDGELTPSAISVTDLKKSGFSLNRDFVREDVVRRLISDAQLKQPEAREQASVSRFRTDHVEQLEAIVPNRKLAKNEQAKPEKLFSAHASPQAENVSVQPPFPENLAHAHVLCLHSGDGTIKALRAQLLPLLKNIISVERFIEIATKAKSEATTAQLSPATNPSIA